MIQHLLNPQKFIPTEYHKSFFDIDFLSLKKQGFKLIISDLDNTLISYDEHVPNKLLLNQLIALEELGFEIVLLSNNNQARMNKFLKDLHITGFAMAR
ncbi:MAG: HAD hydrolase family protein, partial [Candidatus Izimaplasma sp.]|nr:HAD hydrolase family protein [Candidatus Izimaplasma bacterium]